MQNLLPLPFYLDTHQEAFSKPFMPTRSQVTAAGQTDLIEDITVGCSEPSRCPYWFAVPTRGQE